MFNKILKGVAYIAASACIAGLAVVGVSFAPMVVIPVGVFSIAAWSAGCGLVLSAGTGFAATYFQNSDLEDKKMQVEQEQVTINPINFQINRIFANLEKLDASISKLDGRLTEQEAKSNSNALHIQALTRHQTGQQTFQTRSFNREHHLFQQPRVESQGVILEERPMPK